MISALKELSLCRGGQNLQTQVNNSNQSSKCCLFQVISENGICIRFRSHAFCLQFPLPENALSFLVWGCPPTALLRLSSRSPAL